MINSYTCIIFAGGKSSRMGKDKSLLPFANTNSLTEFQYNRLQKIFSTVIISCKDKTKFDFDAKFIEDEADFSAYAPTSGFISVFNALQTDAIFVLSVDTPFVSEIEINKLCEMHQKGTHEATIARTPDGIQSLCGIYTKSIKDKILQCYKKDNHKLSFILENSLTQYIDFPDKKTFFNINNPDQYEEALKCISNSLV